MIDLKFNRAINKVISSSSGNVNAATTSFTDVTNLSVSLTVKQANPVWVGLVSDGSNLSGLSLGVNPSAAISASAEIQLLRDATVIHRATQVLSFGGSVTSFLEQTAPPGSFHTWDFGATPGSTYTYKVQFKKLGTNAFFSVLNCKLLAMEMTLL